MTLKIYDALGREVVTLISHEKQTAKTHIVHWNATNGNNQKVTSGFYFAVLRIDDPVNLIEDPAPGGNRKVTKLIYLK